MNNDHLQRLNIPNTTAVAIALILLVPIVFFAFKHLLFDNTVIGIGLSFAAISLVVAAILRITNRNYIYWLVVFLLLVGVTLLLTTYYYGFRGLIFLFPYIAALFYLLPTKLALITGTIISLVGTYSATYSVADYLIWRTLLALGFTLLLSYFFSTIISRERSKMLSDLEEDYLTGALNKRAFRSFLDKVLQSSERSHQVSALFYIDINDFKNINDTYGHEVGDLLLQESSNRMQSIVRSNDMLFKTKKLSGLARLAGDEFALFLSHIESVDNIREIAVRLSAELQKPYVFKRQTINANASIGIAIMGKDGNSVDELLRNADAAMYLSKTSKDCSFQFFDKTLSSTNNDLLKIDATVQQLKSQEDIILQQTPIINSLTSELRGVVYSAELTNSLGEVLTSTAIEHYFDNSVIKTEALLIYIETVFKQIKLSFYDDTTNYYSLHIPVRAFNSEAFLNGIDNLLSKYNIAATSVELLVDGLNIKNNLRNISIYMDKARAMGFRLALRNYGLDDLPIGKLISYSFDAFFIPRSIVSAMKETHDLEKIDVLFREFIDICVAVAKVNNADVIVTGIEDKRDIELLKNHDMLYFETFNSIDDHQ
ncbi:MAG: diguanylate cyclase [Gammaproteobacteria bacterium]|nr:diguanylate cyclase [Gammaproteobacteria bacterium]